MNAIFATKPIGIYHLLPHACIQDTALYPQKGHRKCMSAKKVEWLWWRSLKLHLCSLAANLSAPGSPVSRHFFSFSVFPKMQILKFTWASHFGAYFYWASDLVLFLTTWSSFLHTNFGARATGNKYLCIFCSNCLFCSWEQIIRDKCAQMCTCISIWLQK